MRRFFEAVCDWDDLESESIYVLVPTGVSADLPRGFDGDLECGVGAALLALDLNGCEASVGWAEGALSREARSMESLWIYLAYLCFLFFAPCAPRH